MNNSRVLIVDDDRDQLFIFSAILTKEGFDPKPAQNCVAALEILAAGGVDLIISDLSMPNMNGLAFANLIKNDPTYSSIPFIIMTAGRESVNFSEYKFKADKFVMKHDFKTTLLPELHSLM